MQTPRPLPHSTGPRHVGPTVRDLMTTGVVTIRTDAMLSEAIALLADSRVSGLAVVNSHEKLVGVVTASDVLNAEAEAGDEGDRARLLATTEVGDVMTRSPLTIGPDADPREAALEMDYADVHRLFVIAGDELVGVISRSDISRGVAAGRLT